MGDAAMPRVDALTERAIASLRHALGEDHDHAWLPGAALCVLVDPALHDPLARHEHTRALTRWPLPIERMHPARRPYLLHIPGSLVHERALNASLRTAVEERLGCHDIGSDQPRSVCAWIALRADVGHAPLFPLAQALARRAALRPPPPHRGPLPLFRYWDPRVTLHLPACLGDAWAAALQAMGVRAWWTLNPLGALCAVGGEQAPGHDARAGARTPTSDTFSPDARQWQALQLIGWRNRVAQLLPTWGLLAAPAPRAVGEAVQRALAHGLHEEADVLAFVHCALTVHPLFHRHGDVSRALAGLPGSGQRRSGFATIASQWSEAWIDMLRRGEWRAHHCAGASTPSTT